MRDGLCNERQGFLFSRPLPADALAEWWRQRLAAGHAVTAEPFQVTLELRR